MNRHVFVMYSEKGDSFGRRKVGFQKFCVKSVDTEIVFEPYVLSEHTDEH